MSFMYDYFKCECPECGRKILVERALMGVSHTVGVYVICLECLMKKGIDEDYKTKTPKKAKDIEDWYNSLSETVKPEES